MRLRPTTRGNWHARAARRMDQRWRSSSLGRAPAQANLFETNLAGASLRGANLAEVYMRHADLNQADLFVTTMVFADLSDADLDGVDMRGANLIGALMSDVNFSGADMRSVTLIEANLRPRRLWVSPSSTGAAASSRWFRAGDQLSHGTGCTRAGTGKESVHENAEQ